MIAGLYNQDSSFFSITSPDIKLPEKVLNEDIISFTYEEEVGRFSTGTLSIIDNEHYYSQVLKMGAKLEVSFGYATRDLSENAALLAMKNFDQLKGGTARTGVRAFIINPSGSASADGKVIYNCNFYGREYLNPKKYATHTGIPKKNLVRNLFADMGIFNFYINFTRGNELLNKNTQIMQRATSYRLLLKLAREWRCIFRVGNAPDGSLTAVFISPEYIGNPIVAKTMGEAVGGSSIFVDWKEGVGNTMEYTWKNHQGANGTGDNVVPVMGPNGQMTFMRYVTKGDTIKAYEFKPERVKKKLESAGGTLEKIKLMAEFVSVTDFAEIEQYFVPVDIDTAPQGFGYSMQLKMLGMPLMSVPIKVVFGEGFPIWFNPKDPDKHRITFYSRKVTHRIDNQGYKMDLDIVDAFTYMGGTLL